MIPSDRGCHRSFFDTRQGGSFVHTQGHDCHLQMMPSLPATKKARSEQPGLEHISVRKTLHTYRSFKGLGCSLNYSAFPPHPGALTTPLPRQPTPLANEYRHQPPSTHDFRSSLSNAMGKYTLPSPLSSLFLTDMFEKGHSCRRNDLSLSALFVPRCHPLVGASQ